MLVAAVVLDMDGLMIDTEPIYKAAWQQASTELGYDLTDGAYLNVVGRDNADGERELVKQFGSGFPMASFRARWSELWQARVNGEGIATKPGLFEFLAFVEERGLPVAVATSSHKEYTEQSLGQAGLVGRFDAVVTGDQNRSRQASS